MAAQTVRRRVGPGIWPVWANCSRGPAPRCGGVCPAGLIIPVNYRYSDHSRGKQNHMGGADTTMKTGKYDWTRFDSMTDREVRAAALKDPDARPLTDVEFARVRHVARTKTLRRALGLTQEEFASRFQIPPGTLRNWEQGRAEPDQTARTYLRAIAGDAAAVQRALRAGPADPIGIEAGGTNSCDGKHSGGLNR